MIPEPPSPSAAYSSRINSSSIDAVDKSDSSAPPFYSQAITPLYQRRLDIHPACLEFPPSQISEKYPSYARDHARDYFVVGTYQLREEFGESGQNDGPQERVGGISLWKLSRLGSLPIWQENVFQPHGIYDIKFVPYHLTFAASTTTGCISIFDLSPEEELPPPRPRPISNGRLPGTDLNVYTVYCERENEYFKLVCPDCHRDKFTDFNIKAFAIHCHAEHQRRWFSKEDIPDECFHPYEPRDRRTAQLKHIATHRLSPIDSPEIIISLSWCPLRSPEDPTRILLYTTENGDVYVIEFSRNFKTFKSQGKIHEHILKTPYFEEHERAWTCVFQGGTRPIAFSGGDDNCLRASIYLQSPSSLYTQIPPYRKIHALWIPLELPAPGSLMKFPAGVTAILPLPIVTHNTLATLLVGSYDNRIRLITMSNPTQVLRTDKIPPKDWFETLIDLDLGGGVYRLRLMEDYPMTSNLYSAHPTYEIRRHDLRRHGLRVQGPFPPPSFARKITAFASYKILACCMHAGTKILDVTLDDGKWSISVEGEVKDNQSMCYAADVQSLGSEPAGGLGASRKAKGRVCVSSSWQDSMLSVWSWNQSEVREGSRSPFPEME